MKPIENAFTRKPDLTTFLKKARHSHQTAELGRKAVANPTPEQRYLFEDKRPAKRA